MVPGRDQLLQEVAALCPSALTGLIQHLTGSAKPNHRILPLCGIKRVSSCLLGQVLQLVAERRTGTDAAFHFLREVKASVKREQRNIQILCVRLNL